MSEIRTCADSLLHPGTCCAEACIARAVVAVLDVDLVEHARCEVHREGPDTAETKPLVWDPLWEPPGRHEHAWQRETVPGVVERAVIDVNASGFVVLSEELVAQLLVDAGWERTA